jgi:hypothetical protein
MTMSRSDEDKRIARIDQAERARRMERRKASAAEARRADELKLLGEVKEAKACGTMPAIGKAKLRSRVKPGHAPVKGERAVDNPYRAGEKITATVNLAEHPLEMMLARRRLTQAQYEAGIRFRAIYEHAMIGPGRGIDPGKIKVDGGKMGDPLSDAVLHAHFELKRLSYEVGEIGMTMLVAICGRGETVTELAKRWPCSEAERQVIAYVGLRLREVLDLLAEQVWGAKGPERGRITGLRADIVIYDEQAVAVANQTYMRKRGISM